MKMYFLSTNNFDKMTLIPRVPKNFFTKNGYEDNKTKRISFAPSIDKALMGLPNIKPNLVLYVHEPYDYNSIKIKYPTQKEVPDVEITEEIWSLKPTKIKYIGIIKVIGDKGLCGHKFKYGKNEAFLYDWDWDWICKSNKSSFIENNNII